MAMAGLLAKTVIVIMGRNNSRYGRDQQQQLKVMPVLFGKKKEYAGQEKQ
jgi:hypothetical protein